MDQIPESVVAFLAAQCGVSPEALGRLEKLAGLLDEIRAVNVQCNLTRILSAREFWIKHVADSVAATLAAPDLLDRTVRLLDVGCGAGFPLFPLVLLNPRLDAVGLEPRKRRAAFVESAARHLGVEARVRVVARQACEAARLPGIRGMCHVVTARAVGSSARIIRDAYPALAPGGRIVLYKTPRAVRNEWEEALREAKKRCLFLKRSAAFSLPESVGERQFLVAQNRQSAPGKSIEQ
ncbi:MAG: 16S rRNA (guanine(527)-N(7))-methyltransferase RsmG [Kiritimatiellaeota bacterium]|nr:16S rRNA (guanine(527)-N(7))-methyltransferase RsmG [Kiritimatiellota bacterium]